MDESVEHLVGLNLIGIDGQKIGRINAIYVNSASSEPEWVAVNAGGLFGAKLVFAPFTKVTKEADHALVDFEKKYVKHAPSTHTEGVLSPAENDELYRYYGIDRGPAGASGSHDAALRVGR